MATLNLLGGGTVDVVKSDVSVTFQGDGVTVILRYDQMPLEVMETEDVVIAAIYT